MSQAQQTWEHDLQQEPFEQQGYFDLVTTAAAMPLNEEDYYAAIMQDPYTD
jgi:hypothetical protein